MNHLAKLFQLLELTRSQPQYGYALAGIPKAELSDLAQHHYLVTIIAWHITRVLNSKGANLDVGKVLEFAMIHDLGELFGGDISMPYAKANPKARQLAKAFEEENQKYLAKFFGDDRNYIEKLGKEILDASIDEALVAKLADYIECTHFKSYVGKLTKGDITMANQKMKIIAGKINNEVCKTNAINLVESWSNQLETGVGEIFESSKSEEEF